MESNQQFPKYSSSATPGILVAVALIGSLVAVFFFRTQKPVQDGLMENGFNLNHVDPSPGNPALPAFVPASAPEQSGLNMISTGDQSAPPSQAGRRADSTASALTQAVRANEARYQALAVRYTKKYPVIAQYGRDWMKCPDLHRFNDQYFQDHDPIKFAWNVARSPNFAALVTKYAHRPEMTSFVMDAVRSAPADLSKSVGDYLSQNNNVMALADRFSTALGLPAKLLGNVASGKMDSQQAAASMINSNLRLQNLLQQNNLNSNQINAGFQAPQNLPTINRQ